MVVTADKRGAALHKKSCSCARDRLQARSMPHSAPESRVLQTPEMIVDAIYDRANLRDSREKELAGIAEFSGGHSPLLVRRGGRDINKKPRSLVIRSGRGGQSGDQVAFHVTMSERRSGTYNTAKQKKRRRKLHNFVM